MLHVGYNNYVQKSKVLSITRADTAPSVRARQCATDTNKLIDCAKGRKVRSLIFLDAGFIVTSHNEIDTLMKRWNE